jgi:hypothetical protein
MKKLLLIPLFCAALSAWGFDFYNMSDDPVENVRQLLREFERLIQQIDSGQGVYRYIRQNLIACARTKVPGAQAVAAARKPLARGQGRQVRCERQSDTNGARRDTQVPSVATTLSAHSPRGVLF